MSGLNYASLEMCDDRNMESAADLSCKDVIILTGGHVPTQNRFFREISLKEKLNGYTGLVIAWSAGSMNCADPVYAGPELPGEAVDPDFQRWIPGLGLTKTNIFPHFEALKDDMLDGMRLIEDITFADSMTHEIIAINKCVAESAGLIGSKRTGSDLESVYIEIVDENGGQTDDRVN